MANRFPLIVDSTGTAAIKELASGDNLDLTGNGIVGVGTIALTNLTVSGGQGTDGQVLTSTGSGVQWETPSASGISDVVSDTSPQLGGSLDVNGQSIVSTSNGNIALTPNGSGKIVLDGLSWPTADGSSNYVLKTDGAGNLSWTAQGVGGDVNQNAFSTVAVAGQTSVAADATTDTITLVAGSNITITTDDSADSVTIAAAAPGIASLVADTTPQLGGALDVNGQDIVTISNGDIDLDPNGSGVVVFKGNATKGSGQFKLNCEANTHGVIIKGPAHSAAANYTLTLPTSDGNADQQLKTDGSGNLSWVDAGGGGAWNVVSSTTLSSAVASVELTLSGYDDYEIRIDNMNPGTRVGNVAEYFRVHFSTNGGTSYSTNVKHYMKYSQTRNSTTLHYWYGGSYSGTNTTNYIDLIDMYKQSSSNNLVHSFSGIVSVRNNASGTAQKHGSFEVFSGRDYSDVIQYFFRNGYFGVEETSPINKVKFDWSGSSSNGIPDIPVGTRFVVYGLSNS